MLGGISRAIRHTTVGLLCLTPVISAAQSLKEAVLIAIAQYPSIVAAKANQRGAEYDIMRAQGAHWPQLSWSGTYNAYDSGAIPNNWIQSPTVSLNLWSGGRIESDVDRSRALAESSQHQLKITKDQVALLAVQGYLNWVRSLQLVNSSRDNVKAHEKIHGYINRIAQVDIGRSVDLEQSSSRLNGAISALQQSEAGLEGAKERVRRMLLGTLPNQPSGFEEALGQLPNSLDDAMLHATNTNPIIAQQIALIKAAQANIGNALSQFSPQVSANYGKQVYQGSAQGNYVGQLVVTVPIVQGGTAYGATQTAYAQLEAAEQTLKDVRLTLQENLKTSWSNWRSSEARISTSGKQTTSAASVVEIYWKQYQVGRRQILELLNAQNELYNAQVALITARFDTLNFRASVLSNMGRLAILYEIDQQSVSNVMPRMNSDTLLVK